MKPANAPAPAAKRDLYLTTVDKFGRDIAGDSVVAGKSFRSLRGHPGLPFGCGALRLIDPSLPRWLVIDAIRAERDGGLGGRVFEGAILFDGDREKAVEYLHDHGAGNRPHLGLVREVGEAGVASAGPYSIITAGPETVLALGPQSRATAGAGVTLAGDAGSVVEAGEFAAVAGSDKADVTMGDFGTATVRMCGKIRAGQAALAAGGPQSLIKVGTGSIALAGANSALDVGEGAWAVGKIGSRFRGKDRAVFVAERHGAMLPLVAFVGIDGLQPDVWYQAGTDKFEPTAGEGGQTDAG